MLEPARHLLTARRVILASGSPRRSELLRQAGLPSFEVIPSTADENLDRTAYAAQPWKFAEDTAALKANEVFSRLARLGSAEDKAQLLVIGADTVVVSAGAICGKPADRADALTMLADLSGKRHDVYTGVCLVMADRTATFSECTGVVFDQLSSQVIEQYVASGEPMDKAGSYGIQGLGGTLVKAVEGDYFNVVGFPLNRFCKELSALLATNTK